MGIPFPDRRQHVLIAAAVAGAALVALVGLGASPARAADFAVIDYQAIFDKYEGTSDAQRTLDRELKEWDEKAKDMRRTIQDLEAEIESQRLMLSEDRLREKQDELERQRREYQSFAEDVWGVNGKAAQRNAELTAPIAEKILEIVARIGEEKNLHIIFDAGTGGVVWAKDDVNITQTVLDDLSLAVRREGEGAEAGGDPGESADQPGGAESGGSRE